jgi:multiple sugar transport system ATP-binding protein
MATVEVRSVVKRFGSVQILHGIDVTIEDRSFVVLLGPSGCGKSTLLRMIAGLEQVSEGEISIGGRVVNDVPPKSRDVAMVFQNYALYPHMKVFDNMAFSLMLAKVDRETIHQKVRRAAEILNLTEYLDRYPRQLSGGQRQRVAMGRAIVRHPQVFLMDEPLSNLDAKLRVQTRTELAELQQRLGVTTVYVTHDQVEAMTMGHRVAVLKDGILQQCDTPGMLYHSPVNRFVAGFIGSPAMNIVDLTHDGGATLAGCRIVFEGDVRIAADAAAAIGFRPEAVTLGDGPLQGRIRTVEDLGSEVFVHVAIGDGEVSNDVVVKLFPPFAGKPGDDVTVQLLGEVHVFDSEGGRVATTRATLAGPSDG